MTTLCAHTSRRSLDIVIITMGLSPIVTPLVASGHNIKGLIECAPRKPLEIKEKALGKTGDRLYRMLVDTMRTIRPPAALYAYSKRMHIPYYAMDNGSDARLEHWVKTLSPDLIVVYSMSQLLKENIFSIPRLGTINLHPSCLPKYRGPNPWFWTAYHMEKTGGVTIHFIDQGEDTGDIILQKTFEIPFGITSRDLRHTTIDIHGVALLLEAVEQLASGSVQATKQPAKSPTPRAYNPTEEEYETMIDWKNWGIHRVWHLLRSTAIAQKVILNKEALSKGMTWQAQRYVEAPMHAYVPGRLYREKRQVFIACSNGKIFLRGKYAVSEILKIGASIAARR